MSTFAESGRQVLATTALCFEVELCGRRLRLRRPREFCAPPDGSAALNVAQLRRLGLVRGLRHLFVRLPVTRRSLQELSELVTCLCGELSSFKEELGPAMLGCEEKSEGFLIEMQSSELALEARECLSRVVLDNEKLTVYLTFA